MSDEVDPALATLLPRRDPGIDPRHLARTRAVVDSRLAASTTASGGLLRRAALAGVGGGGMWAALAGTAAAHKAATVAVGLSVLLGGVAVETTGVGPAVRDSVAHAVTQSDDEDSQDGELLVESTETPEATPEDDEGSKGAVSIAEGNPLPGNLVTHLGPKGRFQLRAEIVSADGTTLVLLAADGGEVEEVEIDVSEAEVVAAGNPANEIVWEDYVDYGVFVSGVCLDEESAESLADCQSVEVTRVQLLGRAGQGGQLDGAGQPDGVGESEDAGASEGAGQPEGVGQPQNAGASEDAGPPDDAGAPEGAGKPDDVGRPPR